jgi:hypothetical protein
MLYQLQLATLLSLTIEYKAPAQPEQDLRYLNINSLPEILFLCSSPQIQPESYLFL